LTAKICVAILPETIAEALNLIEKIETQKADLIEVRLDRFKDHNKIAEITKHSKTPLIATNRAANCQGKFVGSETQRQQTLLNAAKNGFEYVDIELSVPKLKDIVKKLRHMNVKPIISFHDFAKTPSLTKLNSILKKEIDNDADVCKIITTAKHVEDNLTVLDFASKASRNAKVVCFSMGELGKPSRFLSPIFGAFFTIASFERGKETASGQLTIQEMKTAYQALGLM
jgi:3-dehydroquinate dehydratase/shikimate dehydrogenase